MSSAEELVDGFASAGAPLMALAPLMEISIVSDPDVARAVLASPQFCTALVDLFSSVSSSDAVEARSLSMAVSKALSALANLVRLSYTVERERERVCVCVARSSLLH